MRPNRFRPLWSPYGHQVIVPHSNGDLVLVQADGSGWQPLTRGMPATARWSPDGKRLAVWRGDADKAFGSEAALGRFLPPIGQEDTGLSDAEVRDRYFQQALAKSSYNSSYFLAEYAQALEQIEERSGAQVLSAQERGTAQPIPQELPSLYIVEVPETKE